MAVYWLSCGSSITPIAVGVNPTWRATMERASQRGQFHNDSREKVSMNVARKLFTFKGSLSALLCLTALAKLFSVFSSSMPLFNEPNPIFSFFAIRTVLVFAAVLELSVAVIIAFSKSELLSYGFILWLSTLFVLYRFGLNLIHYRRPCDCLGGIGQWLGISNRLLSFFSLGLLLYMFCGAMTFFLSRFVFFNLLRNSK